MTLTEHGNIQMTSALAAVTAPTPPTKRKMYAHQLVNELEEIYQLSLQIQLTVAIKDRPLRELDTLDGLVDVKFLSPFRTGWSCIKAKGGKSAVYRARRIKAVQLEAMYRALSLPRLSTLHVDFPAHFAAFILPRLDPSAEALRLSPVPTNATPELVSFLLRCYHRGTRVLLLETEDPVAFDAVKQAFSIVRYEFEGRYTRVVLSEMDPTPSVASGSTSALSTPSMLTPGSSMGAPSIAPSLSPPLHTP